jgi:oligopeptide/dipeptide ABC transporter ATP-binding protein
MTPLLEVRGLVKSFAHRHRFGLWRQRRLRAVDRVDLQVAAGECLALVGESGSGKTTLARCMIRLVDPDRGEVRFAGDDLLALGAAELRRRRRRFQMVFQSTSGAIDPRFRVADALAEPLRLHRLAPRAELGARVAELLAAVGLPGELAGRYPHQLSGGQLQRVGIARALATEPELLILDEPVSALDASARERILGLLADLRRRLGLSLVFIAHDLTVVERIADRVAVLYLGRSMELAAGRELFARPRHPYTRSLLASVPIPDPDRRRPPPVRGELPSPLAPPSGCVFHPRCPLYRRLGEAERRRCRGEEPALRPVGDSLAACHFSERLGEPEAGGGGEWGEALGADRPDRPSGS